MTVAPPSEDGAAHDRYIFVLPVMAVSVVGGPGVLTVVALTVAEGVPVPAAFTAATLNVYVVPVLSPVTVADVAVEVPSANVVHVVPLSDEYSIV